MPSQEELVRQVVSALKQLKADDPACDNLASYLYTADPRLAGFIDELEALGATRLSQAERRRAGELMESIAVVSFMALAGASSLKSFQSAGPQFDLLVEGSDIAWKALRKYCYFRKSRRGLLLEAKATKEKVGDGDFARLCAIMDNLPHVGLGVFLTLKGASGFQASGAPPMRALRDCRLRQALYYARTKKPVIVLDEGNLRELMKNGSLPRLIHRKVKEIGEAGGLTTVAVGTYEEVLLPAHLRSLV